MNSQTIVYCVVSFLIGMLLAHMLKSVCGCKVVEGLSLYTVTLDDTAEAHYGEIAKLLGSGNLDGISYRCLKEIRSKLRNLARNS